MPFLAKLFGAFLFCLSTVVYLGIHFDNVSTPSLTISDSSDDYIEHTLTASFRAECTRGCTGPQHYRLSFTNISIGDDRQGAAPENLWWRTRDIRTYMNSRVGFTGGGSLISHSFNLGNWSTEVHPRQTDLIATFVFRIKKVEVERRIANGDSSLDFYLVGEDTEGTHYHDSILVQIPIFRNAQVKIGDLKDVVLSADSNVDKIKTCVYSSTGYVAFQFDGGNSKFGEPFSLVGQGEDPYSMAYQLDMKTDMESEAWNNIAHEGFGESKRWQVNSTYTDCLNDTNTRFRIKVTTNTIAGAPTGVYSDTMTITVMPR